MKVKIIGVGVFSEIMQGSKVTLELPALSEDEHGQLKGLEVDQVLQALDSRYGGRFFKELYLENGSPNLWTRVMLNGRDIRFLPKDKLTVSDGDTVLISSAMAGG